MLLKVHNLHVWFRKKKQTIPAVNGVSFSIAQDDTLGLVGESGSGKTITALAILGLVPPPGEIIKGEILFLGQNLLFLPPKRWQQLRGKEISIIFQDPMTSLNPVFTIGEQIAEVFTHHFEYSAKEAKIKAIELLKKVGIPAAESRLNTYPHQLSGGLRQRVMIAIALAAQPKLLIADEPTTALDVTVQAQILELMLNLKRQMGMSILFISHDLTVVAQVVRRIAVMYAGKITEMANTEELFKNPLHPYTQGLLNAIPRIEDISDKKRHLRTIAGQNGQAFTTLGCSFAS
ncbi:MAG: ABC transporter ATP-binding protein, partial [Candidatus Desulfofervidus auxilii]|nr:ABC transporter ATP-binding protein [Candidatus Desulfofervidus auxilii]